MKKTSFETGPVLLLSFSHFVHDIYSSFLAPLLPLIIGKLSISLGAAGILSTALQLPSLLNPVIGLFADRTNPRWFIITAPTLTAVPMSLIGLAPSYGVLLFLLSIAGLSTAVYHVPAPVVVSHHSGPKIGRGMSFYMAGGEAARMLGPIIAVGFVTLFGLRNFYPIMLFGLLSSVLLYVKIEDVQTASRRKQAGSSLLAPWREMKQVLLPLFGILTAKAFMHSAMAVFLSVYLTKATGNLWIGGSGLAVYEGFGIAGVLSAGSLSDRFGRKKILFLATLCAPTATALFVLSSGFFSVLMLLLVGFSLLSVQPVMLAVIQEQARDNPAAANGLFMMVSFAATSASTVIVGFIGDLAGLDAMYLISGALGLFALLFVFKIPDNHQGETHAGNQLGRL